MKFNDFKIFKFSAILKIIDLRRHKFSRIYKNINFKKYKYILVYVADFVNSIIKHIFSRIHKSTNIIIRDFSRIYKNINFKKYNFSKIYKYLNIKKYKYVPVYVAGTVVFAAFIYLNIPMFFNYDKSKLENTICKNLNIKCSIQGKINYSFYPSPRIKIKDLIIQDFVDKKKTFGKIENAVIKLSFYNLSNKSKLNFVKLSMQNAEINFDLSNFKEYKNFSKEKFNSIPIDLKKSEIKFFDGKKSIVTIRDVNFKYKTNKNSDGIILKGNFLNDDIYINLKNKKNENDLSAIFILKFLNTNTKINIFNSDLDKNTISGNVSFKKGKNRLTSIFDYKNDQIIFKQAYLRNAFLDGNFNGEVKLLPYFKFNLNVDLNTINFNSLYSFLIALDEKNKKNLFKVNEKINGQLNISVDKIFSHRMLVDSFESRIKFINGNILIEQLLLSLGKLGAADITGIVKNNEKFSNFKFENNIFIDNLKRFYNKFGIFNKQNISSNLFISGNFDLANLRLRLDEISDDKKFNDEDVAYFEKEFNNLVLEDGYTSLFNFIKLKEFVRLITTETN